MCAKEIFFPWAIKVIKTTGPPKKWSTKNIFILCTLNKKPNRAILNYRLVCIFILGLLSFSVKNFTHSFWKLSSWFRLIDGYVLWKQPTANELAYCSWFCFVHCLRQSFHLEHCQSSKLEGLCWALWNITHCPEGASFNVNLFFPY